MTGASLSLSVDAVSWPMKAPFIIHGHRWDDVAAVAVTLERGGAVGRGEGAPLFYREETVEDLVRSIERSRAEIEAGEDISTLDLISGARNALDCALWDLRAKQADAPVWALADLPQPKALPVLATIGLGTPAEMEDAARQFAGASILKIKLDRDDIVERVAAVRAARPDARLIVDANCGWSIEETAVAARRLFEIGVEMIEQPVPPGEDADIGTIDSPIPLCADESCQSADDLPGLVGRYDMVNIKLDKAGGFTASLDLARKAQALGLDLMVGNMLGSSLAMAPAFHIGQLCKYADLDGPLLLSRDHSSPMSYADGVVAPPAPALWG